MDNKLRSVADLLEVWLLESALPLWWTVGADRGQGGFHEAIGTDGRPILSSRRARVQGRQSYVYAQAGALGWTGPWKDAALHGLRYLDDHYRNSQGLYCTLVSSNGSVVDETVTIYDQAFVLLALAWVCRTDPSPNSHSDRAHDLLATICSQRSYSGGGFVETSTHAFQSNPHMHLFEAALAWSEVQSSLPWKKLSDDIASLCLSHFVDAERGLLREYFDEAWRPHQGSAGQVVEPGHQFEWAWLLERWARMSGDRHAMGVARRLFETGTRGIDRARNVAVDEMSVDFKTTRHTARLWPQTERLKAALILSETAEAVARERYLSEAYDAACALCRYLDTPIVGIWRDRLLPNDQFVEEPAPASSFYHIACAIIALKEATGK